ncbi:hypothetical protein THAOC_05759 [Thalassiosira oceanica]|uniref:Uncharacterized protein n=1 Tax=Thalassiosira oceanica TaxID=159749 RepID=K0T501_THAOC|nr:hypothetical protein THAOC_05759 [Thalassiosira oceanica]|eukprot:EJK72685.1 hypothetical protein THAOC_05759 [Thalassiosira oceanica]
MEVPQKKAKTPPDDTKDDRAGTVRAARQIAELQEELDKCRRERIAMEERHDQVVRDLKSALEWAYTAENIPREHWHEKGYSEEYAGAMEELQNTFKGIIKDLRTGAFTSETDIFGVFFELQHDDGHYITSDHDDVLMPYWKEFANALIYWSEYHAGEESLQVIVDRVATPDAVLDVLRPALKRSRVKYLGFEDDGSPKTWRLAEFIEDIIHTNHEVTKVGFSRIVLSNEEWKAICNAIKLRNSQCASILRSFEMRKCFVDGISDEVLRDILTSNTKWINLEGNGMSSNESPVIAEFLASNPPLASLLLKGNCFDDADAALLADSLSSNTTLKVLDFDGNSIKQEGRLAFLRAIFDVSSLASCAASNHTCLVAGLKPHISDLNNCFDEFYNKWGKIFGMLALSSVDSFINMALLGAVPTSLMPALLYRAHDQDEESNSAVTNLYLELTDTRRCKKHLAWKYMKHTRSLSSVYELVRGWVVPSMNV